MDGVVGMVILTNYQKSKHRLAARGLPPGANAVVSRKENQYSGSTMMAPSGDWTECGCAWRCVPFCQAVSSTDDDFQALGAWRYVSPARRFGSGWRLAYGWVQLDCPPQLLADEFGSLGKLRTMFVWQQITLGRSLEEVEHEWSGCGQTLEN
ncbi:hypothetical protein DEO72_LG10g1295 [Vigna unguiculata]|uniref:Uncharacterized protein n=1 Tax=Vigna unguiculata TaxID=3917 RepID=A0A4D6NBZ4_VIGUN|nr:hypothetical protein DEO72_LG10g1295 [Vigna unguiculata]